MVGACGCRLQLLPTGQPLGSPLDVARGCLRMPYGTSSHRLRRQIASLATEQCTVSTSRAPAESRRLRECRRRLGRFRLGRRVRRPVVGDPTTRSRRAHHGMMHTRVTSSWGCMRVCTKLGQGVLWRVSTSLVRHPRVHPRQAPAGRKRLRGGMACARGRSVGPWRVGSDSYG